MSNGSIRFSVVSRINNPATEFTIDFKGASFPSAVNPGQPVNFTISDPYSPNEIRNLRAYVENVQYDLEAGGQAIGLTGRDVGLYLVRQKYELECSISGDAAIKKAPDLLDLILENTNIEPARGQPGMIDIEMPNRYNATNWFCGNFKTKKDALDWLFKQYQKARGMNTLKWYIDMSGYMRWFERGIREKARPIFADDSRVETMGLSIDARNIGNDVVVNGGSDGSITAHMQDQNSINRFGLQELGTIFDSQLTTQDEVNRAAEEELSNRGKEVYNLTVVFKHYVDYAPGMEFTFPDLPRASDEIFTLVGYTLEGTPAKSTATLEFSTDPSVINEVNTFEAIKGIVKDIMADNATRVGVVEEVNETDKTVKGTTYGTRENFVARYV